MDIIYDGMIDDSMRAYHAFVDNEWLDESTVRYTDDHDGSMPFLPEQEDTLASDDNATAGQSGAIESTVQDLLTENSQQALNEATLGAEEQGFFPEGSNPG